MGSQVLFKHMCFSLSDVRFELRLVVCLHRCVVEVRLLGWYILFAEQRCVDRCPGLDEAARG